MATGSGSVQAQAATAAGTGTAAKIASAAVAAQAASAGGSGVQTIGGSGALAAQAASALGVNGGTDSATASASLAAQAATLAGPGLQSPFGRGPLAAQTALVSGGGRQIIHGLAATDIANRPTAQPAVLTGSGIARLPTSSATGSGVVQAQAATVAAAAENRGPGFGDVHTGVGGLQAAIVGLTGAGTSDYFNGGSLAAQRARVSGSGVVGATGAATALSAAAARISASATVSDGTAPAVGAARIYAYPARIAADASSLIILVATPRRSVLWTLFGPGALVPITNYTDKAGAAYARYIPGPPGTTATIRATYGGAD